MHNKQDSYQAVQSFKFIHIWFNCKAKKKQVCGTKKSPIKLGYTYILEINSQIFKKNVYSLPPIIKYIVWGWHINIKDGVILGLG